MEEHVVLGENKAQDLAGLFGDGTRGIGQVPAFGEIFGADVSSRFPINGDGVISGGKIGNAKFEAIEILQDGGELQGGFGAFIDGHGERFIHAVETHAALNFGCFIDAAAFGGSRFQRAGTDVRT